MGNCSSYVLQKNEGGIYIYSLSELNYRYRTAPVDIYICYSPAGRSVLGKTVLETEGTVFPNTDRPRPVNNIFIYF